MTVVVYVITGLDPASGEVWASSVHTKSASARKELERLRAKYLDFEFSLSSGVHLLED